MIRNLSFLTLIAALAAGPEPTRDEVEYGREKFRIVQQFPDRLAKLRQAAEAFALLPPQRQEELIRLDRDLAKESSVTQARLQNVADRYSEWLSRLPEADRERVRQAPGKAARLAVVEELRDSEWLGQQPRATREKIAALPAGARREALAKARAEDRARRGEWLVARRFWEDMAKNKPLPTKLADFDSQVQAYVGDVLLKLLTKEDRERLAKAEGNWPLYPQTLVELADAHPPALPAAEGPRSFAELPKVVRESLGKKGLGTLKEKLIEKKLKPVEGRPREFAMKLTGLAAETGWVLPVEWWPYSFNGLSPPMQDFLKNKLQPVLDRREERSLVDAEGRWPDYPETIQHLARAHNLRVPWYVLPGGYERWDNYRTGPHPTAQGFPEVPQYKLRDFVFCDLDDLDRIKLKNEIERSRGKNDAEAWAYLVELYFQRYPSELARLRQTDHETLGNRAATAGK